MATTSSPPSGGGMIEGKAAMTEMTWFVAGVAIGVGLVVGAGYIWITRNWPR